MTESFLKKTFHIVSCGKTVGCSLKSNLKCEIKLQSHFRRTTLT